MELHQKYIRKNKIGCGIGKMQNVLNEFEIINITNKNVFISGLNASNIIISKSISINDFKLFINKYKLL